MNEHSNRRIFQRIRSNTKVVYSYRGSEEYHEAALIDHGEGGLCMEACAPVKTGTDIYVQIINLYPEKPGFDAHRSFQGTVRWNKDLGSREQTKYCIGVQYSHPVHSH